VGARRIRPPKGEEVRDLIAVVFLGLFLGVLGLMVSAYVVMIYVGMWHGYNPNIAAAGFVDCLYGMGLVVIVTALGGSLTRR
jgi:hypothetical protein